jgi:hypothetical protein
MSRWTLISLSTSSARHKTQSDISKVSPTFASVGFALHFIHIGIEAKRQVLVILTDPMLKAISNKIAPIPDIQGLPNQTFQRYLPNGFHRIDTATCHQ